MKSGIEQLNSQVDMLMQNVQMTRMTVRDQPFRASVTDLLTRTDAQIVMASFSNENYASDAKELSTLCDKELKQSIGGVSNESVKLEMQRRPGMYGRLVIPSVGVNVALFNGMAQSLVDAVDSAAFFPFGSSMLVADHWNQGFTRIKSCHAGTKAYIYKGDSIEALTCTGISKGINNDYDLLYADGASATTGGGILMYTCNGANYHDVTITFWR